MESVLGCLKYFIFLFYGRKVFKKEKDVLFVTLEKIMAENAFEWAVEQLK